MPSKNDLSRFKDNKNQEPTLPSKRKPIDESVRKKVKPPRSTRGIQMNTDYHAILDRLASIQKYSSGKNKPDLAEEAFELLFAKYNIDIDEALKGK